MTMKPQRWRRLTVIVVVVNAILSCGRTNPDENGFARMVAMELVNDELIKSDKIAVLDASRFGEIPVFVQKAIRHRLNATSVQWVELDLGDGWERFPGTWKEGRFHRANETHLLLDLEIKGDGSNRTVRWTHVCGPNCGRGAEVTVKWDDDRWKRTVSSIIRY